jgi:DNA replication protein DnaC
LTLNKTDEEMLNRVKVPPKYWDARLSLVQDEPHKVLVTDWFENIQEKIKEGKGLYIFGTYGLGKSALAAILLKKALVHGIFGLWTNFKPLIPYYKNRSNYMFDDNTTMFDQMLKTPLLVIDEFAIVPKDWWAVEIMEEVIRCRVQNKLSTIITSNHFPSYFVQGNKLGATKDDKKISGITAGLVSILTEATEGCQVTGKSYRDKK